MSRHTPQMRRHICEASKAPLAVILRQSPSRQTRLIRDVTDMVFTPVRASYDGRDDNGDRQ